MTTQRAPWAEWSPFPGHAGGGTTGDARKITLHTTEGGGWPTYGGGGSAPHLTVNPATGQARQHIDLDRSAYALASPGAPNSPNMNAGLIHIQIEIIGYAAQTPGYSDDWYRALAGWVAWLCDALAVPRSAPWPFMASSTAVRQSWGAYAPASGIVGHQHAPYNDHWDPGAFDIARLLRLMQPGTDWLLEGVIDMAAHTIVFFAHNGRMYEADLIAGTYRPFTNEPDYLDRRNILATAGVPFMEWGGTVDNIEAFGRQVSPV